MEKRTIAQAAIEVLKEAKRPLTAVEITQVILDKGLYDFNTKEQKKQWCVEQLNVDVWE